jgi:hypothetical protein
MHRISRFVFRALFVAAVIVLQLACSGGDEDPPVIPTVITVQPSNQTVNVGQQATFSVATSGPTPTFYQWHKGWLSIPGATSPTYTTPPTVQTDDAYSYWVELGDPMPLGTSFGKINSASATLTVLPGFSLAPGSFIPTGLMLAARSEHTATLLPNGRALVVGGRVTDYLASTELYDPSTSAFMASASMSTARGQHTATLLANGKILIAGGRSDRGSDTGLSSAEIYDSSTGTFMPTGSMSIGRVGHTATLLLNGKVLVAGGRTFNPPFLVSTAELYDPSTGAFTPTSSMTASRGKHTATLLPNGKVLLVGGETASPATADLYDPATAQFTSVPLIAAAGIGGDAVLLTNGQVLAIGGRNPAFGSDPFINNAQQIDPIAGTSVLKAGLVLAREGLTATWLSNGKVLVVGGAGLGRNITRAELYDPATDTFSVTGGTLIARLLHTATLLNDGKVLIAGGQTFSSSDNPARAVLFVP